MTRILRLLLIAAVALPLWQPTAAQEKVGVRVDKKVKAERVSSKMKHIVHDENVNLAFDNGRLMQQTSNLVPKKVGVKAIQDVPVADGTATNSFVPIYPFYLDYANHGQIIYPASELNLTAGSKINSITFYANNSLTVSGGSSNNPVTLKLGETTTVTYSNTTFITSGLTTVATLNSMITGTNTVTFTFNEPYVYNGGNLIVDVTCNRLSGAAYTSNSVKWYGKTSNGASIHSYSSYNATAQNFLPRMTMNVDMAAGSETRSLDFETVNVGNSKTLNANIANASDEQVTATVAATAPFSVASSTVTLVPSSEGNTAIPVTFTPTSAASYHGTLTVTYGDVVKTISLSGIGNQAGVPCTRDSLFFAGIEYKWPISTEANTSSLDEIATDPDQIIAMLRKVYMDQDIPGNLKRGYNSIGGNENYNDVSYSGVGGITRNSYSGSYSYNNYLGWAIPNKTSFLQTTSNDITFTYMNATDYKPNVEGVTLVLIEMVDNYDLNTFEFPSDVTGYDLLRSYVSTTIKSARVVTQSKRTGEDLDRGTLFKIDCDKMNKFFLLAKGQLRWIHDSYYAENSNDDNYVLGSTACPEPCYVYNNYYWGTTYYNGFHDSDGSLPLFSHMFEQFSPVVIETGANIDDLYQSMVSDDMTTFGVYHDCVSIPFAITNLDEEHGHQFMMYGVNSDAVDCQDVRDMMFFVPDYRMLKDDGRDFDENYQKFNNYNTEHRPTMGLFVIRQNVITGEQVANEETYRLHLSWKSNLLDFLPGGQGQYTLYRVTYDDNGNKVYTAVGEFNPNTLEYYDNVPMQASSQEVTYVVRGQDVDKFLSLQFSNERSFIIPGLDPSEMVVLEDATHYSRYNPQTEKNCYSNKLKLSNSALGINNNNITGSTQLTLNRIHTEKVDGVSTIITEPVANITFNAGSKTITVTMDNQSPSSEYPNGKTSGTAAGYHANPGETTWTIGYTVVESGSNAGNLIFSLPIFDNFTVDVSNNEHPASYAYSVESNYNAASTSTSVYLNASNCTTGEEVWYAWTWNNANDGKWVKGITQGNLLKFVAVKNNILFARLNPNHEEGETFPSNNFIWNQTADLSTGSHIRHTYTLGGYYDDGSGYMWGTWSSETQPEYAHSNSTRVPVYKTGSQMTAFKEQQVLADVDGTLELPNKVIFDVDVQMGSRSDIYRYDAYRWKNTAANDRYILDIVNGDEEDDVAPTGMAGNQGASYSVSMNEIGTSDYLTSIASLTNGWGVAHFEDMIPAKCNEAAIFDYAPVVETMASGFDLNRTDYNTYGGPLQSTATAKAVISVVQPNEDYPLMSTHTWKKTVNGVEMKYAYYNINVNVDTKDIPNGYDIYMIRAWREIDESLLGEECEEMEGRISGDILFEEIKYPDYDKNDTYVLGSKPETVEVEGADGQNHSYRCFKGTFGAQKLRTSEGETGVIDELEALFTVRIYFTKNENLPQTQSEVSGAPVLRDGEPTAGDGKFYVVEAVVDKTFKSNEVVTGIIQNLNTREAIGVKYYNVAGIESDTPFKGVNIVVTRYSDGSTTTTKILK